MHHIEQQIQYYEETLAWLKAGAPEGQEPWRNWECLNPLLGNIWAGISQPPRWIEQNEYRRKLKMRTVGDISFPEPVREPLEFGREFWVAHTGSIRKYYVEKWSNHAIDRYLLASGLIHLTQEAAIAHAEAIIKFNGGTL